MLLAIIASAVSLDCINHVLVDVLVIVFGLSHSAVGEELEREVYNLQAMSFPGNLLDSLFFAVISNLVDCRNCEFH